MLENNSHSQEQEFNAISGYFDFYGSNVEVIISIFKHTELAAKFVEYYRNKHQHLLKINPILPSVGGYWLIVGYGEDDDGPMEYKFNLVGDETLAEKIAISYRYQFPQLQIGYRAVSQDDIQDLVFEQEQRNAKSH